jgi:predicted nuclease of predicted toxin-antitoxin system
VPVRFLLDEDIGAAIADGLRRHEWSIDVLDVKAAGLRGTKDVALLELAFVHGRILVTHDRTTMVRHFCERIAAATILQACAFSRRPAALARSWTSS